MKILSLPINDAIRIETDPHIDDRGKFSRLFCSNELKKYLDNNNIVQINYSENYLKGSIRGLHFQHHPKQEIKLISCTKGKIFDVIVDLRKKSTTFLQWYGLELSQSDNNIILVPEGCAHGFQVLENFSDLLYLHSEFYDSKYEDGIPFDDPMLNISWPLKVSHLSGRDSSHSYLNENFKGL